MGKHVAPGLSRLLTKLLTTCHVVGRTPRPDSLPPMPAALHSSLAK